jgi:hypothetical protein
VSELTASYFILGAAALGFLAWLWATVLAFRLSRAWGFVALFPATTMIFLLVKIRRARGPISLFLLAGVIALGTITYAEIQKRQSLGPYEAEVNGESHLTLTDWDRGDYSLLRQRPRVVVLQMANADVTNETLQYLDGMNELRELDLSNSAIDDDGLALLANLPALRTLRLRGTRITEDGFRKHLFDLPNLMELSLPGPPIIKSSTVRKWKATKPGRMAN